MRSGYEKVKDCAVFVHGAGGGAWEWAIWQRVFRARGWRVIARDLQPVQRGLEYTHLEDYVRQVEDWVRIDEKDREENEQRRIVLVGASLGGLLALIVAARIAPAAVVLVNPLPPKGIEPRCEAGQWPDVVPWGSARSFASTCRAMADADDAARWFAFRRWRDESGAALREAAAGVAVDACACPMLVVASELDADVPAAAGGALAAARGASFQLLRGANHLTPLLGRTACGVAEGAIAWAADVFAKV
jgi:pimeloyl-ACP methyl ester carboxylesterase